MPTPVPSTPRARPSLAWIALVIGVLLLPALLRGGFVMDDRELLFENPVTSGALPWSSAFDRDYFHHVRDAGAWRPLASLSLRVERSLFGERALYYHLSNGLLHLLVVLGVAALLAPRVRSRWALFGACAIFGLHPALCDSFVWISGRTSMLSALGPLGAALVLRGLRAREASPWMHAVAAGLGLFVGLLGKEDAVIFAPALLVMAWPGGRRQRLAVGSGLGVALVAAFLGRWYALGGPFVGAATPALAGWSLFERLQVGALGWFESWKLFFVPHDFPPQYTAELLKQRAAPLSPAVVAILGALVWVACLAPLVMRRRAPLALTALAFLPVMQLVPIGEVFAARFMYLPLLFATPLIALAFDKLPTPRLRAGAAALLAVSLASLSFARAGYFESRETWRLEQLRHDPEDAGSWNNLGLYYEEVGRHREALESWRRATEVDPRYSKGWSNLGRVHYAGGELELAERAWRRALKEGPSNPVAHVNLATLLVARGDYPEAGALYRRATELSPGLSLAWRGLARARFEVGRREEALLAIDRAIELEPGNERSTHLRAYILAGGPK
jgi:protein O-mannosyl-transferase